MKGYGLRRSGSPAVMAKTKAAAKATDGCVRGNPWMAVGITVAFGLVLGILAARR